MNAINRKKIAVSMSVALLLGLALVANPSVYAMLNSTKNTTSTDNSMTNIDIGNDTVSCSNLNGCGGNPSDNNPPSDNGTLPDTPL